MAALPEVRSAVAYARSQATTQFKVLDPETALEIEALAAQIIPSTDGPGAREAGVIFFIDRALETFASENRAAYREGMAQVQAERARLLPDSASIHSLTEAQQIRLMQAIDQTEFFELLRLHTVLGFLGDPTYGGNRGEIGWKQIGFDNKMRYEPPFGYYDAHLAEESP
jgi:gluconate 2-dehydrogenase gamma chain